LHALYILLIFTAYTVFVLFGVRRLLYMYIDRFDSLAEGPSDTTMFLLFFITMASAFFTDTIGVHAVFGGYVVGLMVPHEGGFADRLINRIENLVLMVFLPIYFALAGLKTQLGLLDSGAAWGLLFLVIAVAVIGKVGGCTLAARFNKLTWRESATVGVLMSCKGLVELIVLSIGLEAGAINERIFAMMVVMALVTTFMTVPLTLYISPPKYRDHIRNSNPDKVFDSTADPREEPPLGEIAITIVATKESDASVTPVEETKPEVSEGAGRLS